LIYRTAQVLPGREVCGGVVGGGEQKTVIVIIIIIKKTYAQYLPEVIFFYKLRPTTFRTETGKNGAAQL